MTIGQQLLEKRFLEIDHDRLTIRARVGADTVKYHLYEKWVIDEVNRQVGAWQHDGKVFSAAVFGERFAAALKKIGARGDDFALTVVVCQGWPHMPQVSITPEDPGHSQLRLRIADDRAKLAEFRADWLVAKVRHDLDALGIDQEVNPAQLTAALLRARTGDFPAGGERLHLVQKRSKLLCTAPWRVVKNRLRNSVEAHIYDLNSLATPEQMAAFLAKVNQELAHLQVSLPLTGKVALISRLERQVEEAREGVQALGIDLPLILLAGMCLPIGNLEQKLGDTVKWTNAMTELLSDGEHYLEGNRLTSIRTGLLERTTAENPALMQLTLNKLADRGLTILENEERLFVATTLALNEVAFGALSEMTAAMINETVDTLRAQPGSKFALSTVHAMALHMFPVTHSLGTAKRSKPAEGAHPWLLSVLREMVGLDEFYLDASWIRDRLWMSIPDSAIAESIEALKKLGWIRWDAAARKWLRASDDMVSAETVKGDRVQTYYRSMFALSSWSVLHIPVCEQQLTITVMPMGETTLAAARKVLGATTRRFLGVEAETTPKTAVYQVNGYVMPLRFAR